jgi:hypothetical protein
VRSRAQVDGAPDRRHLLAAWRRRPPADSFVFQSHDFGFASDAFVQVVDRIEIILDSETLETLVTGEFREVSVSPD